VGSLLDRLGTALVPQTVLVLMAGIWITSLFVSERAAAHLSLGREPLLHVLRRPEVMALLAGCFLAQMSHGPYYAFYSIYLEDHGYTGGTIGQLWALGVIAEVALYLVMHRVLQRVGLRPLFLLSLALTTLRWVMIGLFPGSLPLLVLAQTLHAASFGIYHAVAIQLFHRFFVGRHQGRGQALYSSLSFGAGGAMGSLLSGYAWEDMGGQFTYLAAAGVAALALVIVWRWLEVGGGPEARPLGAR